MAENQVVASKLKRTLVKKEDSVPSPYFSPRRTRNYHNEKRGLNVENPIKKETLNLKEDEKPLLEAPSSSKKKKLTNDNKIDKEFKTSLNPKSIPEVENLENKNLVHISKKNSTIVEPHNWKIIFENLKKMRSQCVAPVDVMGCDMCADENVDEKTKRYHILVSLMLSSQTKDEVTFAAMNRLKATNLTPFNIIKMNVNDLEKLLHPVSFYKVKSKHLQKTADILINQYDSDIPKSVTDLVKLPGVGPKMAHICMKSAWNIVSGIGVDVHVHRISNRLGWVKSKTPEETRKQLESWLPFEYWSEVNHLLVGFGQTVCLPVAPKCKDCLNRNICPSAFKKETNNKKIK